MNLSAEYSLDQTRWPALAQAVRERLVLHMQRQAGAESLRQVRLVISLCLIPDAPQQIFSPLLAWLSLQTPRIEITASRHGYHKLYIA